MPHRRGHTLPLGDCARRASTFPVCRLQRPPGFHASAHLVVVGPQPSMPLLRYLTPAEPVLLLLSAVAIPLGTFALNESPPSEFPKGMNPQCHRCWWCHEIERPPAQHFPEPRHEDLARRATGRRVTRRPVARHTLRSRVGSRIWLCTVWAPTMWAAKERM